MTFDIQSTDKVDYYLVELSGRMDRNAVPHLIKTFDEIKESGQNKVLLNLSNATFLSSRALWTFNIANEKGLRIAFLAKQDSLFTKWTKTLTLFWPIDKRWRIHSTVDEALISLNVRSTRD